MWSASPGPGESVPGRNICSKESWSVAGCYSAVAGGYYITVACAHGTAADLAMTAKIGKAKPLRRDYCTPVYIADSTSADGKSTGKCATSSGPS